MKRLLMVFASLCGLFALWGCGTEGNSDTAVSGSSSSGSSGSSSTVVDMFGTFGGTGSGSANNSSGGTGTTSILNFQAGDESWTYAAATASTVYSSGSGFGTIDISLPTSAGTNSTVSVVTDSAIDSSSAYTANVASVGLNMIYPGGTFTATDAPTFDSPNYAANSTSGTFSSWSGGVTLGSLAEIMYNNNNTGDEYDYVISQQGGLDYSAFGMWMYNNAGASIEMGTFAFGTSAVASSIPTSGSASYSGYTLGAAADGTHLYAVTGDIALSVNFADSSSQVYTQITDLTTEDVQTAFDSTPTTGTLNDLSGYQTISGATYSGTLTGTGYTSAALKGGFLGGLSGGYPAETAGVWTATTGTTSIIGSYGAAK